MFDKIDSEIRIALMQGADEAREMGHRTIGPEHLLLGLLTNVRGATYRLLTAHGMRFDTAREALLDAHTATAEDAAEPDTSSSLDDDREALRAIGIDLDTVRDAVKGAFGDDITDDWGERRGGRGRRRGAPRSGGHRGGRPGHHGGPGPASGAHGRRSDRPDGPRPFWEGGDDDDFFAPWGPGSGRGRRGPRSRRFGPARFDPSMHAVWEQMRRAAREGEPFDGVRLLLALMDSDRPAVRAMLAGADDLDALRADAA